MEPFTITSEVHTIAVDAGVASGRYRYVTDAHSATEALRWVLEAAGGSSLEAGAAVGIDLETTSLKPEDGRIRLAQVAAGDRCVVLDAFAFDPWPLLRDAVASHQPLWIAHNAEFEQSWLARHAGFTLLPMFDTRWVYVRERAQRTGKFLPTESSLAAVCEELLELPLSKEQRLSDWSTPKLSFAQIEYAALDALVLIRLRELMEHRAIERGWTGQITMALRRAANEAARFGTTWAPGGALSPLPMTGTDSAL
jgi:ribonuclease D